MLNKIFTLVFTLFSAITMAQGSYDIYKDEFVALKQRGDRQYMKTGLFRNEVYIEYPQFEDTVRFSEHNKTIKKFMSSVLNESPEFNKVYGDFKQGLNWFIGAEQAHENSWSNDEVDYKNASISDIEMELASIVNGHYFFQLSYTFSFYYNNYEEHFAIHRFLHCSEDEPRLKHWSLSLNDAQEKDVKTVLIPRLDSVLNYSDLWQPKSAEEEPEYDEYYEDDEYDYYPDRTYYPGNKQDEQIYEFFQREERALNQWLRPKEAHIVPVAWGVMVFFSEQGPASHSIGEERLQCFLAFDDAPNSLKEHPKLLSFSKLTLGKSELKDKLWLQLPATSYISNEQPIDPWMLCAGQGVKKLRYYDYSINSKGDTSGGYYQDYFFSADGKKSKLQRYKADSSVGSWELWRYDQDRMVLHERYRDDKLSRHWYSYDKDGNCISEEAFGFYDNSSTYLKFTGSKAYRLDVKLSTELPIISLIEERDRSVFISPTTYFFDSKDRLIAFGKNRYGDVSQLNYAPNGALSEFHYDANRYKRLWDYDSEGRVQKAMFYDGSSFKSRYSFAYESGATLPSYAKEYAGKGNSYHKLKAYEWWFW